MPQLNYIDDTFGYGGRNEDVCDCDGIVFGECPF
jgi:hypothetical protein